MSVIRYHWKTKRKWPKIGRNLIIGGLCFSFVLWTAPYLSDRFASITALSAAVSFQSKDVPTKGTQGNTITQYDFEESSINEEAGLVTDPETESEPIPEDPETDNADKENIPDPPKNAGKVVRRTLSAGNASSYISIGNSSLKSTTSVSTARIQELSKAGLPFTMEDTSEPQVLIYHTHATESYQPYQTDWYDKSYNARSTDESKNMIAVGNVMEQKLKDAGIGVIHDKTLHDKSYTGAYDRSRETINKYLKKYPSIKVVLDVHRDAIGSDPVTAPVTTINGKSTAQIMIIACKGTNTEHVPNYEKNLSFACSLQQQIETDYPSLARPMLFGNRFYNQDLSNGALLIEVGGHGNTLQEAKRAIGYTTDSLITLLQTE